MKRFLRALLKTIIFFLSAVLFIYASVVWPIISAFIFATGCIGVIFILFYEIES